MIVYKKWIDRSGAKPLICEVWLLFGVIPLFIRQVEM